MVSRMIAKTFSLMGLLSLLLTFGCGADSPGTLRVVFNVADGEQNDGLLATSDFVELEIVIEGDALAVPIRNVFSASTRSARVSSLPAGTNYRVSVFGLKASDSGMTQASFYGASGHFDMTGGEVRTLPIQIGRSNCISANNISGLNTRPGGNFDMNEARDGFATAVLPDGRILVIGGGQVDEMRRVVTPSATIEVFDPIYGDFRLLDYQLTTPRAYHSATTLPDGSVLVFGGVTGENGGSVAVTAELILPNSDFPVLTLNLATADLTRYHHDALRLHSDGSVLIVGGYDSAHNLTASVIRYFPDTREFVAQGALSSPRAFGGLGTLKLPGYPAVYASGLTTNALSNTVELFSTLPGQGATGGPACNGGIAPDPRVGCFVVYEDLDIARSHFEMLTTYGGKELLFLGGYTDAVGIETTNSVERFRQEPTGALLVERLAELPFSAAELAGHAIESVTGIRRGLQSYLVAGGRSELSVTNGSVRIEESAVSDNAAGSYVVTSLDAPCKLPEARTNLVMVGNGTLPLLLLGGHRYDGGQQGWVSTKRAEVYFTGFNAVVTQ
jgi:hypothetical protein